jgi:heme-degrading monooxygenase HmoA
MILRILRAQIFHELKDEFEKGPALMSVKLVLSQKGCVSCQVTKPLHKTSNTYAMISLWENKQSLKAFVGEDFETASIPAGLSRYISSCSVEHYISTEPIRSKSQA